MNTETSSTPIIQAKEGPFKNMMTAAREMALMLSQDELEDSDQQTIRICRERILESITLLEIKKEFDTKEEVFVDLVKQIVKYLDEHGYTPEAFYDYQLEHGTLG